MRSVVAVVGMLLLSVGLLACGEGARSLPSRDAPALGERFTLGVGQSASIADTGFQITYTELIDDSRCPPEVTCVWEGDAVIAVSLAGSSEPATAELHTYDQRPGSVDYGDCRIELLALSQDGNRATFVATR